MTRRLVQLLRNLFRNAVFPGKSSCQLFCSLRLLGRSGKSNSTTQQGATGLTLSDRDTDAIAASAHGQIGVVRVPHHGFNGLNSINPYVEDVVAFAASVSSPEARQAILCHSAWMCVNHIGSEPFMDERYPACAKLAAELWDDDCTGIYLPAIHEVVPTRPGLSGRLRSFGTLQQFIAAGKISRRPATGMEN
jgi:hypothetical protein